MDNKAAFGTRLRRGRRLEWWQYTLFSTIAVFVISCVLTIVLSLSLTPSLHDTNSRVAQTPQGAVSPTATHMLLWTTTQTFQGNGNKKTTTFAAPNEWKLRWSCDPTSSSIGQYNVIVNVYAGDRTPLDYGAVNTLCKSGNTRDETAEHQGGTVYLEILSEGAWTVQVQVLK